MIDNTNLPEKSYFKAMAGCAVRGHLRTAKRILNDKINSNNIDVAISEFLDFCRPKDGWSKEIDKQFKDNTKIISGETSKQGVLRELKEEIGLELESSVIFTN